MPEEPDEQAGDPELQAEAYSCRERADRDREIARRAGHQDRLGQGPVERYLEPVDHQISAPPPNEKKVRKKLVAANAIERPNTIWMSLRKPPEVSPKASVRPVIVMMITATMRATGPSIEERIWSSGPSQGMPVPAACAGRASPSASARLRA